MASYTRPNAQSVISLTGLSELITGASAASFQSALEERIVDAEDECAVALGESTFDGDSWTTRQARLLARAVSYRTANIALDVPWLQYATGTQEPLLMDPDELAAVKEALLARAQEIESLVTVGHEERPFALPAVGSSTFSYGSSDRTLTERNLLTDERDNVSAWDVEHG